MIGNEGTTIPRSAGKSCILYIKIPLVNKNIYIFLIFSACSLSDEWYTLFSDRNSTYVLLSAYYTGQKDYAVAAETNDIPIAYGRKRTILHTGHIDADWNVIRPQHPEPLSDPRGTFLSCCRHPAGSSPLRSLAQGKKNIVIVTSDGTRPVPNRLLIPWILEELEADRNRITVILGTGTHRPNTDEEIEEMFGTAAARSLSIINHDAYSPDMNVKAGTLDNGTAVFLNRTYMESDLKIAVGFIEPHFFAGFSGGAKAIVPGIASIDTVLHAHSVSLIAHPESRWGATDTNPLRQNIEDMTALAPPDFLINVTLNPDKEITGIYCGDCRQAHAAGCTRAAEHAMSPVTAPFPLVITSNSGYPLDQNLYQTVKGISAASLITERGGTVIAVSECCDGIPDNGNFCRLMQKGESAEEILDYLFSLEQPVPDQWQAQVLCNLLTRCRIRLFSRMERESAEICKLEYAEDLQQAVEEHIRTLGPRPRVAILPDGPLTIPYVRDK